MWLILLGASSRGLSSSRSHTAAKDICVSLFDECGENEEAEAKYGDHEDVDRWSEKSYVEKLVEATGVSKNRTPTMNQSL